MCRYIPQFIQRYSEMNLKSLKICTGFLHATYLNTSQKITPPANGDYKFQNNYFSYHKFHNFKN